MVPWAARRVEGPTQAKLSIGSGAAQREPEKVDWAARVPLLMKRKGRKKENGEETERRCIEKEDGEQIG